MIYNQTSYGTIQAALNAAGAAGGGIVYVPGGTYAEQLALKSKVTLMGEPGMTIIRVPNSSNADAIVGTNLTGARVVGIEVDGNKSNQTGGALSGDDPAITGRGIFLSGCVNSEIVSCYIHDCRLHGILIYNGSDNKVSNVRSNANGKLSNGWYANGLMIYNSPRCNIIDFVGNDNDANSGLSIRGAVSIGAIINGIRCSRNGASNITINSPLCQLSNFYATDGAGTSGHGLNIGHNSDPDLYADNVVVSNGVLKDNAVSGLVFGACVGGSIDGVICKSNARHNLLLSETNTSFVHHVNHLSFSGCVMDTTTQTGAAPAGDNILITSLGAVDASIGDYYFDNCQAINAVGLGLRVAGASRVYWHGGVLQSVAKETNGQPSTDVFVDHVAI